MVNYLLDPPLVEGQIAKGLVRCHLHPHVFLEDRPPRADVFPEDLPHGLLLLLVERVFPRRRRVHSGDACGRRRRCWLNPRLRVRVRRSSTRCSRRCSRCGSRRGRRRGSRRCNRRCRRCGRTRHRRRCSRSGIRRGRRRCSRRGIRCSRRRVSRGGNNGGSTGGRSGI